MAPGCRWETGAVWRSRIGSPRPCSQPTRPGRRSSLTSTSARSRSRNDERPPRPPRRRLDDAMAREPPPADPILHAECDAEAFDGESGDVLVERLVPIPVATDEFTLNAQDAITARGLSRRTCSIRDDAL